MTRVCYPWHVKRGMRVEKRALAVFDFDGTMIRGDSIVSFVLTAYRRGVIGLWGCVRAVLLTIPYGLGLLSDEQFKTLMLGFYQRLSPEERRELDETFVREELLPRVYPAALERLEKHRQENCLCLLVSASTENYMTLVKKALGFDGLICSRMDEKKRVILNCRGEKKLREIDAYLQKAGVTPQWEDSYAYGDTFSDLPMLTRCGHGTKVNPRSRLRRAAPELPIEEWKPLKS